MKLKDLIEAFASEIELAQARLDHNLEEIATLDVDDPAYMDALDQYSGQAQRMGEAAELAGFPGLQLVCLNVVENSLMLAAMPRSGRADFLAFLRAWPPLIVYHLRNLSDPSSAAGLVDHLRAAPYPMEEEQALKVMHMLGAMPSQVGLYNDGEGEPRRQVLATSEDVALVMSEEVDRNFLNGFFQEAPEQARHLVLLANRMASGASDHADIGTARRLAHTLKGSGATAGLRGVASLGHHLEDILDYFESDGGESARLAANTLLDAAYCLEQMIAYITGADEYPQQSQGVLQAVLDLANRIDAGESMEPPLTRTGSPVKAMRLDVSPAAAPGNQSIAGKADAANGSAAMGLPSIAQRVSHQRIDSLFRVSGEISVNSAAMETRIKALVDSSRELLEQNMRLQKRLFELETAVEVRALTMLRSKSLRTGESEFDPLEMDQYNELHGISHALTEEAADARALALQVEDRITHIAAQHVRQQHLKDDLQHLAIGMRMAEVNTLESRLQRNVRLTSEMTGKEAVLVLEGGDTLIDSELLTKLAEPLLHLLRNAVDHGVETPEERIAAGKPRGGRILLSFSRHGQQVVLRCQDDGRGLDMQAIQQRAVERGLLSSEQVLSETEISRLILLPGFSTRHTVSEISGRGIGLDVVRDWVNGMNGSIRIVSKPDSGCTFELQFAASLSIVQSLIVDAAGERFALPSTQIEQAVACGVGEFEQIGERLVYHFGKASYQAIRLADIAGLPDAARPYSEYSAVIVRHDDKVRVLAVDKLLDARELFVNPPGRYARHLRGIAGISILGDGAIAVNLDLAQLLTSEVRTAVQASIESQDNQQSRLPKVLIVDDSLSVRNSLSQLMQDAGYQIETARDGIDAIDTMRAFKPDVLLTDLEMPNMNGIELAYHMREREDVHEVPIIMITSRSQEKHRRMAEQAGIGTYITKPYNDVELLQTIRRMILQ
jgi:chemosensory pili system protein ChpA (sensor histidine kinase/response regulator)